MTTSAVLPTTGAPPPGLRRPEVAAPASRPSAIPEAPVSADPFARSESGSSGAPISQSRASGVAVQVIESGVGDGRPVGTSTRLPNQLSDDERAEVSRLSARDREVRTHEAAHQSAGAGYASAPNFDYVRGPDGRQYAVGGHVKIDTSAVPGDPKATIAKMEVVRAAALAPARPSGQDRSVAAAAAASIRDAEIQERDQEKAAAEAAAEEQAQKKEEAKAVEESGSPQQDGVDGAPADDSASASPAPFGASVPDAPATSTTPSGPSPSAAATSISGPAIPSAAPVAPSAPTFTPSTGGGGGSFPAPQVVNLINLFA